MLDNLRCVREDPGEEFAATGNYLIDLLTIVQIFIGTATEALRHEITAL
jgi:hypothetical protein